MRNNTGVKLGVCHMWLCWIHQVFGEGEVVGVWCKSIQWKDFTAHIVTCAGINLGEKSLFVLFNDLLYSVSISISLIMYRTQILQGQCLPSERTHQDRHSFLTGNSPEWLHRPRVVAGIFWLRGEWRSVSTRRKDNIFVFQHLLEVLPLTLGEWQ